MKPRILIGLLIVAAWSAAMLILLERELGGRRIDGPVSAPDAASSTWLGLYLAGGGPAGGEPAGGAGDGSLGPRVGHAHLSRQGERREGRDGVRLTMDLQMALQMLGRETDLHLAGVLWRALDGELAQLDLVVDSLEQSLSLTGRLEGGELRARISSGGESFPLNVPMDASALLGTGFGASLDLPQLDVGDDVRLPSFDPLTMRRGTARIRALAEETLAIGGQEVATKRLEVETGGMTSIAWVDAAGEVVRAETPVGLVVQRLDPSALATSEQTAVSRASGDAGELLERTAIVPAGERPFRGARRLVARARMPETAAPIPTDGFQRFSPDGELVIESGPASVGQVDSAWLRSDAFVQSEHPRLQAQARAIVGDLEGQAEKARAIHAWVWREIEKVPVMSLPSALEVLDSGRGDCNEHTVLFTALARAASLPTRMAVGLVWSDDLGGFYYHAWPEVLIDGRFHRFDPTLGQEVADATHIKLLEGGIASWPRLLPYLGQLELDVLEVE